jgi:hypothetical protein
MTQPATENERIRSYLQSQAAKLGVPDLIEKVRVDSQQLLAAARSAEAVDNLERPSPEDWCVNEVLNHVRTSCVGINAGIIAAALHGGRPAPIADQIVAANESREPVEWFNLIHKEREATFAQLAGVTGEEHLGVKWEHPFFGELNWREWLLFLRLHDLDHARQVQGIVETLASA